MEMRMEMPQMGALRVKMNQINNQGTNTKREKETKDPTKETNIHRRSYT
jgi:hypothetical protein